MAITERYVTTTGAGAHNGTSEADAWSLTEAATNAVAGQRVNVKTGSYTLAANFAPVASGTVAAPIIWRGYNTTIGDLDDLATRLNKNTLAIDTTNFPAIDTAGFQFIPTAYNGTECLRMFSGTIGNAVLALSATGSWAWMCHVTHTGNVAGSRAIQIGSAGNVAFFCEIAHTSTGANPTAAAYASTAGYFVGCRIYGNLTTTAGILRMTGAPAIALGCIVSSVSNDAVMIDSTAPQSMLAYCTIYAPNGACVATGNVAATMAPIIFNCTMTDSNRAWRNYNSATSDRPIHRVGNRTRDNANADSNSDWPIRGAITTDTGGAASDFVALAALTDFRLTGSSPAAGAGLIPWADPGALARRHQKTVANLRGNLQ